MKLIIFIFCFLSSVFAQEFSIHTEEMPPYNYKKDEKVRGLSTLFLERIMMQNKTPINVSKIHLTSWSRAYKDTLKNENGILYSAARTPEREGLFKWVGPIDRMQIGLIAKKSKNIKINSVQDLNKYKIGTMSATAAEHMLLNLGVEEKNLDRFSYIESQLKKLAADRVDIVAFSYQAMKFLLEKLELKPDEYELIYTLKEVELYYAFNKKSDDKLIENLNNIIIKLNSDKKTSFETLKKNSCFVK